MFQKHPLTSNIKMIWFIIQVFSFASIVFGIQKRYWKLVPNFKSQQVVCDMMTTWGLILIDYSHMITSQFFQWMFKNDLLRVIDPVKEQQVEEEEAQDKSSEAGGTDHQEENVESYQWLFWTYTKESKKED